MSTTKATKGENMMSRKKPLFKEENGIRYILAGDSYLPDIIEPTGKRIVGRFKSARAKFLLNHRRDIYLQLQKDGKVMEHLELIEEVARETIDLIMERMLEIEPIPESLKNTDTLQWVGLMNSYRDSAIEIVMHDVIFREDLLEEMEDMELPDIDPEDVFREYTPAERKARKSMTKNVQKK